MMARDGRSDSGVLKDRSAVSVAIISLWSNGQSKGQITKLKLVKRQKYGIGKLDLLQARPRRWFIYHQECPQKWSAPLGPDRMNKQN
ncbi:hypothetical protein X772_32115 [Mesorhizobium sp. LSJC280B00]|nr:hypothetical protein X772_32115 [Mesorhizobium sp. LSJC280B00]